MAKSAPNKKKFFLLLGGVLVLSILSYKLAFSKTLDEYGKHSALKEKVRDLNSLGGELARWKAMNANMDAQLGGQEVISGFQESLLNSVGLFCAQKNLVFADFSEPFEGIEGGYSIETIILKVQGNYKPLLELVHHLEHNFKGGKLASASFYKEKNYRKNREELFLEMYVQKIKISKDEEQ